MNKYLLIGLVTTLFFSTSGAQQSELHATNTLKGTAEAQTLLQEFPFLEKLLTTESPWEMQPEALAKKVFDRMPEIAQGDEEYPLLFSDRREENGWPGA